MRKLLTLGSILLLSVSSFSHAIEFANSDGSRLTEVCIAAADSDKALEKKASEYGFTQEDLDAFTCNGLSIDAFGKKYRNAKSQAVIKVYAFEMTEDSRETELCIAAATSNEIYKQVKKKMFKGAPVGRIECNGLPIAKFAKRYGNRGFIK